MRTPSPAIRYLLLLMTLVAFTPVWSQVDSTVLSQRAAELEDFMFEDYPEGFRRATQLLKDAEGSMCTSCLANAHRAVGRYYWANGEYNSGIVEFRLSLQHARKIGNTEMEASVLNLIGNTYYYQAYYDSALNYFNQALDIHEREQNVQGKITVLHNISLMFHRKGDFSKTIEYLFKEEQQKSLLPVTAHEVEALGAMGSLMVDSIHYWDVIRHELQLVEQFRKDGDKKAELRTYRNIGKAYRQLEDFQSAARYFVKASQVMEEIGQVPDWDLAATDYRDANVADSAFYFHHSMKRYFPRMTQPNIAYTLELLGDAHRHFLNFDSARIYYDSALQMSYRMNNRITFTGIHRYLTGVHTNLREFDKAEKHLLTGLALAKTVALIHERNLFREGKHLYETKGDFQKALYYSEKYRILQDSIHKAETAIDLTRLQAEFKSAQKAKEVDELRQQTLLHQAEINARNLQIALTVSLLVIFAALGVWYYTRLRHKTKTTQLLKIQNDMIEEQNRSLSKQNKVNEALLAEIHHRVKNNLQIISSLINLKARHASTETTETLIQLGNRIFTMGLIHEKLYQTEDVRTVRLDIYLKELIDHLIESLAQKERNVNNRFAGDPIEIEADRALACGLICNELITNSLKYAFTASQATCEIEVQLLRNNGHVEWMMKDNGESGNSHTGNWNGSFGLRFVEQLVMSKLGGTWKVEQSDGFKTTIDIPVVR
jgi:two-component sensor histidine kinase